MVVKQIPHEQKYAYPVESVVGAGSALLLFAAACHGQNDGWVFRRDKTPFVTAVDNDQDMLDSMQREYRLPGWDYVCADAFDFAIGMAKDGEEWEIVSADLPADLVLEMLTMLPLLRAVSSRVVVSTVMRHNFAGEDEPTIDLVREQLTDVDGWHYSELVRRSGHRGGAYWLVQERT